MTHDENLAAAADPTTPTSRLHELAFDDYTDVRLAAMTNRSYPVEDLAGNIDATDANYSESAVDATIARADQFHHVLWHASREAIVLVSMRLTDRENGRYVVSETAFETFIRNWDAEVAADVDFAEVNRSAIVSRCLAGMEPGEGELDPHGAA